MALLFPGDHLLEELDCAYVWSSKLQLQQQQAGGGGGGLSLFVLSGRAVLPPEHPPG